MPDRTILFERPVISEDASGRTAQEDSILVSRDERGTLYNAMGVFFTV